MTPAAATHSLTDRTALTITIIGGPTALLNIGGVNLLTDPTFDPPGAHTVGQRTLTKTLGPSIAAEDIGTVDAVLLSHDQHPDNLDETGRRIVLAAPLVLSTAAAAKRLGEPVQELPVWRTRELSTPSGEKVHITGVPAQHGPPGTEHITGEVRGFVLRAPGAPTAYISGDNASLPVVRDIADHCGPIDVAVIFAGRARTSLLDAYLTFSADQAAAAAQILGSQIVVPLHVDSWEHLTETRQAIEPAFAHRGLSDRLFLLEPGVSKAFATPLNAEHT
ncbi:MBL fold metallo-hydrolase [Mycobacterium paraterrae]|uniref:MBL fold metallo-hydrolase n=1 Tax=Mycobacterium paraterrae TaxID=577492 RepID=A0ABY3VJF7_9MYCO|nr:MBL fold metallo-hydrolase [Mycobacterium paraterrae]UMB69538.1 MBL fold metallo-hydrolase [Mycobacterium paraterrae]